MMARAIRAAMARLSVFDFIGRPLAAQSCDMGSGGRLAKGSPRRLLLGKGLNGILDLLGEFIDIGNPFEGDLGLDFLLVKDPK